MSAGAAAACWALVCLGAVLGLRHLTIEIDTGKREYTFGAMCLGYGWIFGALLTGLLAVVFAVMAFEGAA